MSGGALTGRVAVVTGASKGIGAAIAIAYAEEGAAVVVGGRSDAGGPGTYGATVDAIAARGGCAVGVRCDVRDADDVSRLVGTAIKAFGRLDVLVNNAGVYGPATPIAEIAPERWDEVVATNLRGPFLCCRAAAPHMIEAGGSIVNVTSMAARHDFPAGVVDLAYATSKQALDRLTSGLATELAPYDVAVNGLSPVQIRTPGTVAGWGEDFDDSEYAEPSAIGPVAVFLARQRADFTGRIVRRDEFVDGEYRPSEARVADRRFPTRARS